MEQLASPSQDLLERLSQRLGPRGFTTDPDLVDAWTTDWRGRVRGRAAALLSPADVDEVAFIVREARAARVALVPQGGNSSMVAGATPSADGSALLLSLRRMNRIVRVAPDENLAVVEAGVILSDLHDAAEAAGRRFPLSLAAKGSATVGGLISTNAGGTQVLRFGTMRAQVLGLQAVMPDGEIFEGLTALRKDNRGYDLRQLLIGAEGTLGIVTAASLRLVPIAGQRVVAWAGLERSEDALALLRLLEDRLGEVVESFELVPAVALALVLEHIPGMRAPLGQAMAWNVLIEAGAPTGTGDLEEQVGLALADAIEAGLVGDATIAANDTQAEALWGLRENISEAERLDGMAAKHDVAVPVSEMARFIEEATRAVEQRFPGARPLAFGHLGDGNVHFNVRAPAQVDGAAWFAAEAAGITSFVHDLVTAQGGTMSAEHGIGQTKLADFVRLAGPVRLHMMRAIKQALDPIGIMNPGKLLPVAPDEPAP